MLCWLYLVVDELSEHKISGFSFWKNARDIILERCCLQLYNCSLCYDRQAGLDGRGTLVRTITDLSSSNDSAVVVILTAGLLRDCLNV